MTKGLLKIFIWQMNMNFQFEVSKWPILDKFVFGLQICSCRPHGQPFEKIFYNNCNLCLLKTKKKLFKLKKKMNVQFHLFNWSYDIVGGIEYLPGGSSSQYFLLFLNYPYTYNNRYMFKTHTRWRFSHLQRRECKVLKWDHSFPILVAKAARIIQPVYFF